MTALRLSEVAKIPWGDPPGLPEILVDDAPDSRATGAPPRLRRASVRVRPAADGWFGLLAADPLARSGTPPQVLRLDRGGVLQRLQLSPPNGDVLQWQIVDFAFDQNANLYLLELVTTGEGATRVLRKVASSGTEAWRRPAPWRLGEEGDSLDGAGSSRLLTSGGAAVYLSASRRRGLVARIGPDSGELGVYADLGDWTGDALVGPDEQVYYVRFLPETNSRAWVRHEPRSGRETQVVCHRDAFDLLALPIGVDAEGKAYGVHRMSVGCVGRDGAVIWRQTLDASSSAVREAAGGDRDLRLDSALSWSVGRDGSVYIPAVGAAGFHLLALEP